MQEAAYLPHVESKNYVSSGHLLNLQNRYDVVDPPKRRAEMLDRFRARPALQKWRIHPKK